MNDLQLISQRLKEEINVSDYHNNFTIDTAMQAVAIIFAENAGFPRCTPESKYKAVLSMVVQGLNPLKGQCSLVPYGNQLQLLRDYSGSIMVAKREDSRIESINAQVVRDADDFDITMINGVYNFKHKPTLQSLSTDIVAAYAIAIDKNGTVIDSDIMTIEDVKKTWKNQGLKYKGEPVVRHDGSINPGSNHGRWPEKMTIKTVVHRLCRSIIKSSSNSEVVEVTEQETVGEISLQPKKQEVIDFKPEVETVGEISPESEPECNPEQAKLIVDLWKQLDPQADVMPAISAHFNRQITRLREITQIEAAQYITRLETMLKKQEDEKKNEDDDLPDWA